MLVPEIQAELRRLQLHPVNLDVSAGEEGQVVLTGSLLAHWAVPREVAADWVLARAWSDFPESDFAGDISRDGAPACFADTAVFAGVPAGFPPPSVASWILMGTQRFISICAIAPVRSLATTVPSTNSPSVLRAV